MDDTNKVGAAILGTAVVGFLYLNHKFNKRTTVLRDHVIRVENILDAQFQAQVDTIFADIVENYEE